MGIPPSHILILRATGDRVRGWGAELTPTVAADGGRCSTDGHVRRDFGRRKGAEATGIHQAWREGGVDGIGYSYRGIIIMGRGWGTPRWVDDTAKGLGGRCWQIGILPRREVGKREVQKGGTGIDI